MTGYGHLGPYLHPNYSIIAQHIIKTPSLFKWGGYGYLVTTSHLDFPMATLPTEEKHRSSSNPWLQSFWIPSQVTWYVCTSILFHSFLGYGAWRVHVYPIRLAYPREYWLQNSTNIVSNKQYKYIHTEQLWNQPKCLKVNIPWKPCLMW